jgi:hypothetical protein
MVEKKTYGYGDGDCADCKIILDETNRKACEAVVQFTQIIKNDFNNNLPIRQFSFWIDYHKRLAQKLDCEPSLSRIVLYTKS